MAILTQGSQMYFIDPADDSVVTIDCAISYNPGGAPADQLETTCLESAAAEYVKGLQRPGQATMGLNADFSNASHLRLFQLAQDTSNYTMPLIVGFSDGASPPTADSNGDPVFPTDRTFLSVDCFVSDFPMDFQLNNVVTGTITFQRSGTATLSVKGSS